MGDYRPISCCNTIYKIISKLQASRITSVLPAIIGLSQSAFVAGHRIGGNILLVQELFKNYHRAHGPPRCAIKVDILKAYDSLDWNFLLLALEAFDFPEQFIGWLMSCVTSPKFSVAVNGELARFFASREGLGKETPFPLPLCYCNGNFFP